MFAIAELTGDASMTTGTGAECWDTALTASAELACGNWAGRLP